MAESFLPEIRTAEAECIPNSRFTFELGTLVPSYSPFSRCPLKSQRECTPLCLDARQVGWLVLYTLALEKRNCFLSLFVAHFRFSVFLYPLQVNKRFAATGE